MINHKAIRELIADSLSEHTECPVIMANQVNHIPEHPYISFTVTSPMISNNGTYGRYSDGFDRKPIKQIWSFTAQSGDSDEAAELAYTAHDYFDRTGIELLKENGISVVRVGDVSNRDSLLSVTYEYRCGFDVTFSLMNEIDRSELNEGDIENAEINMEIN